MSNAVPMSFEIMKWKGQIACMTDTFKLILMQEGFIFDPVNDNAYSDVSTEELTVTGGYTVGGYTLTGVAIAYDAIEDRVELTHNNITITATGGDITTSGAIIYDDSTSTGDGDDETDAIVSYKDAGGVITAVDGTPIVITNIMETVEDIN